MTSNSLIERFITQIGDANLLDALPPPTLYRMLAHTDDVVFATVQDPLIELPDLDLVKGYSLYDPNYQLIGAYKEADGLDVRVWGLAETDWEFLLSYWFGDYAYLCYENTSGVLRTILVVHAG